MALLGASASILFSHTVTVVPIPPLHSTIRPPTGYSSLLGPDNFPHPFFLVYFFLFHFHFCCHFVSPLLFPLLFIAFFSFFFFPPFLCFLLFHIGSFSALFVLLRHFSCPFLSRFSTKRLHPLSESQHFWIVHCFHLLPPLDFLLSFSPHYYVPWSPGPALGNFTME